MSAPAIVRRRGAWLLLALACSACAAPRDIATPAVEAARPTAPAPCAGATSQRESSACWAQTALQAEAEVTQRLQQLAQALPPPGNGLSSPALAESQAAWGRYRDAACEVHRQLAAGGSLQTTAASVCRWRLAIERLAELDRIRRP